MTDTGKKIHSSLDRQQVVVPAYSTITIDYIDTKPNYFRVQNTGSTPLYCGTSAIPTKESYDFVVAAAGMKMFTEPYNRAYLYLHNPSGSPINATVLTFNAEFDPLTLALSEMTLDFDNVVIEADTVIDGFNTALPAGTNNIGKVTLDDLTAIKNAIADVKGVWTSDNITTLWDYLADIIESAGSGSSGGGGSCNWSAEDIAALLADLAVVKTELNRTTESSKCFESTAASTETTIFEDFSTYFCKKINFITNDGTEDITVKLYETDTSASITLKAGETMNDLPCNLWKLTVTGNDIPVRCVYTVANR